ncbi:hypothetical protein JCGZ_16462 [Jatropha curcas]|uniref:PWWP domain-containing protein n=1 Tax=Jatropha curcas TaxID=180498 RepID=A0A067K1Y0_JATCU|nr:uncharacterized protein LOC105642172 [Jatropha curcas]KDP29073.1 hypothetical protein JCGZ_16462 [Jatropha curcas]
MSANLDRIDLNSDVVSVEPENDVHGFNIPEPMIMPGLSNAETLTDPKGQTLEPVIDQVKDFEGAKLTVNGLGNGGLERQSESVDREINMEAKIKSLEEESNTVVDVSSGEVVQFTKTQFGECDQVKEELKEGICSGSDFENSIKVQKVDDTCALPRTVDMEGKEVNANDSSPVKDASHVSAEVISGCIENQDMEIDDQVNTSKGEMVVSNLSVAGICEGNGGNNKSSALNLVVDLNSYVNADGKESGNVNAKVNTSKLEFSASDLVWGKVRSHPWWPGQIFDPSCASEKAKKYFKRDSYLIAYFGDQTFAWNEESTIKPFRSHFSQMERQNNSEEFLYAIDCALDEVSRRVEFGLACPCIPEYSEISAQIIVNAGIGEDFCSREGADNFSSANAFEPANFLDYIKELGQSPFDAVDRLEFVTAQAQLLAFSRWKGYSQLPEFQILGTLILSNEDGNELNAKALAEIKDEEHVSSVEVKSKTEDGEPTPKRKNFFGDSVYPRKKEKSLAELFAERRSSIASSKSGVGIKAACKSTSSSSDKKRKAVDSISDNPAVKRSKSLSSSGAENNSSQPKRTYRVGESILRVASQLNGPTPMRKPIDGASRECSTKDTTKEKSLSSKSQGKKWFETEDYSSDVMISQLCLVARNPMKECSFLRSVVGFFVEFRNSVRLDLARSPQDKLSFLECIFGDSFGKESSKSGAEACESEHSKDSCSTDMMIQGPPQERPSDSATQKIIPSVERAQSSPSLDSERQGNGEILDIEATEPVSGLKAHCKDDNCPTALILNFTHSASIPPESNLNKIFSRFGRVKESQTEVLKKKNRAKVVFYRRDDAEAAFSSAGKYSIFGPSLVSYRLKYMPSTPGKSS